MVVQRVLSAAPDAVRADPEAHLRWMIDTPPAPDRGPVALVFTFAFMEGEELSPRPSAASPLTARR